MLRVDMSEKVNDRMRKVKSILVTQEAPSDQNSPYLKLAEKFNLKIYIRPFIEVQPVPLKEFRKQKIEILNYVIFCEESRGLEGFRVYHEICCPLVNGYLRSIIFQSYTCKKTTQRGCSLAEVFSYAW